MKQETKSWLGWTARVVITAGALWFLATKLNWQEFLTTLQGAQVGWLLAALAAYGGVVLVSIVRWHLLLEVAGAAVGWMRTAQLSVAGLFFNSVLPGVMGGDVIRAFWAARDAPQARPAAVVSILLERVLGLAATVLLGAALILPRWNELNQHPVTHAGALAFVTVAGLLLVILAVLATPYSSRLLAGEHSSGWRKAAADGAKACHVCLTHPVGAGVGLLLSLISQALLVTLFFTVAEAMSLPADFWQLASVLPMVAMVTVLPITWNGLGLREAAFVAFLGVFGVAAAQAVAISLTAFAVILAWNLFGESCIWWREWGEWKGSRDFEIGNSDFGDEENEYTTQMTTAAKEAPKLANLRVRELKPLSSPSRLKKEIPVSARAEETVRKGREELEAVLEGKDSRPLVVLGPCSIHDRKAALEYAERIANMREELGDSLLLVMRVYFEKPRTTVGWKGLINDPHLDGSLDLEGGLKLGRKLLAEINEMGVPAGTEFLDPIVPQYLSDLVTWAAIGARTTESQTHREMASGLSMPVGFKNGTDGSLQVAVDAMLSAQTPHSFVGIDPEGLTSVVRTTGNTSTHLVLRGGREKSNFDPESLAAARESLKKHQLPVRLMVDCSHANSGKEATKQEVAWKSVIEQKNSGTPGILGLMLESHLQEGRQNIPPEGPKGLKYGVSVTDACMGWEQTESLLRWAAR